MHFISYNGNTLPNLISDAAGLLESVDPFRDPWYKISPFYEMQPQGDDVEKRSVVVTGLDLSLTERDLITHCDKSQYFAVYTAIYHERQIAHIVFPYSESKYM